MAVQFILGRSGSGKTGYCINAVVDALLQSNDGPPLILLVPEQATYQAERAILADDRIAGYHRLNVLSFDRLQFLLLRRNTAKPALSRTGRQMIIHRILRANAGRLKIFNTSANAPGLARRMADTITELHRYAKTPDDIARLLTDLEKDKRNSLAAAKFADITLVLTEYLKLIEARFTDPDIQLTRACAAIPQADFTKSARLWVDGFSGFTAAELAVLTELLKVAADTQIALCLDPFDIDLHNPAGAADPADLFYPTKLTYAALLDTVQKCRLALMEPVILNDAPRFSSPPLLHIERNIFKTQRTPATADGAVHIISAANARAEARFVARRITRLVRDGRCRYRDIAVVASDIEQYEHYVRAYFDDYDIPYFIDRRKSLNQHPLARLICSAIQVVTDGFLHSDVFACLKTDLIPAQRSDVDLLENYCIAYGVSAGDWTDDEDWSFADERDGFDQAKVNDIRRRLSAPLLRLHGRLCDDTGRSRPLTAERFTEAVFAFLCELKLRDTLGRWIEQAIDSGDRLVVDEHRQFYDRLVGVFDELIEVFGDDVMTARDYLTLISSAFSQLTLAFIPPTLDQVLVSSIERSRHPDLKAVFLIGATQKHFPIPVATDSILTDSDRRVVESMDFVLAPAADRRLREQQYLTYIAFTRPAELLYVTYPLVDDKASAVQRSQFVTELESLFTDLEAEPVPSEQPDIEDITIEAELCDLLCCRLGRDASDSHSGGTDRLMRFLNDASSDERFGRLASMVLRAVEYGNHAELDTDVVAELFGPALSSSATRLSSFAACPYQHFAGHILELKQRKECRLEPLDIGLFYHRLLDILFRRIVDSGKDIATIGDEQLVGLLREEIQKYIEHDSFISNFVRHSAHNDFLIRLGGEYLEDCVLAIARMVRAGGFRPVLSEIAFGRAKGAGDSLGDYRIELSDGRILYLNGRIDRIDVAEVAGERFAIVFDYKRKAMSFDWSKFYHGLDMQLPVYMLAVGATGHSQLGSPVGGFFMPVEVKPGSASPDELSAKAEKFRHKATGIFNGEFAARLDREAVKDSIFYNFYVTKDNRPYGYYGKRGALQPRDFKKILSFTERRIKEIAEEMYSGRIDIRPYKIGTKSPCILCKYKSLCRFDWQINDYRFLESPDKTGVLERIGPTDG